MEHLKHLDSLSECVLCVTPFEFSVNAPLKLPTRGKHCRHRICQCCILKSHIRHVHRYHSRRRRYLDCPACASPQSFHAKRPTVDAELCQALTLVPKEFRQQLIDLHQQPWKVPLGTYSVLLERIGQWEKNRENASKATTRTTTSDMTMSTLHAMVQGLLQVHDF